MPIPRCTMIPRKLPVIVRALAIRNNQIGDVILRASTTTVSLRDNNAVHMELP